MKTLTICALFLALTPAAISQTAPAITQADEVMARVFVRDRQREAVSQGVAGSRRYVFDNERFHKHSEMLVTVKIDPDGSKYFEVVSEEGWKTGNQRILRKMLESESETSRPGMRAKALLTPDNYTFSLLRTELVEGRPTYVIAVTPKRHDKYLFEGQIWIDGLDYALVRVEGKPAKNPSFWTHSVHFVQQYHKTGDFWFPTTTESVTQARIFGKTDVIIRYFDYAPHSASVSNSANLEIAPLYEAANVNH